MFPTSHLRAMRTRTQGIDDENGGVRGVRRDQVLSDNGGGVGGGRGMDDASEGSETTAEVAGDRRRPREIYDNNRYVGG